MGFTSEGGYGLEASSTYFKGQGLGNDYLVFREGRGWPVKPGSVRRVCERWTGVGGDGIVLELPFDGRVHRLRMFNPDGSEFERSGNGLRVFAASLCSSGRVGMGAISVEVGGAEVLLDVLERGPGGLYDVSAQMGRVSFKPEAVGLDESQVERPGRLRVGQGSVVFMAVSVGNPHCVVFDEALEDEQLRRLGPVLTNHAAFPKGVNVQLAEVTGPSAARALVWERGVGRTSSSGTSACAVAAASVRCGRLEPGEISVVMEGGTLTVHVSEEYDVTLRGPVAEVCTGTLAPGFLEALWET